MENPRTFGSLIYVRSNMEYTKEGQYETAVATSDGLFSDQGAAMLIVSLTQAEQDEFNGVKKVKAKVEAVKPTKRKQMAL